MKVIEVLPAGSFQVFAPDYSRLFQRHLMGWGKMESLCLDGTDERCFMETIQDEQTKIKVVSWPSPQDYNEAVQNLEHSMLDPDLRSGAPELNAFGLPKPNSGSFASVYKISSGTSDWALRCFLHNRPDQHERYKILHAHLESIEQLDCLVSFSYLEEGIRVHGRMLPALKMSWASGVQLIEYIEANLKSAKRLAALRDEFKKQMQGLKTAGIAHGDLQHGNILVLDNKVQLVDYDGMYVSSLESLGSLELGHRNFQHPKRTRDHFGPWLDNFPAWVIFCSLTCLMHDPSLWNELDAGDECLLFRSFDFMNPLESRAFYVLENHRYEQVRVAAKFLRSLLDYELEEVPYLDELPVYVRDLPEVRLPEPVPVAAVLPAMLEVGIPVASSDWPHRGLNAAISSRIPPPKRIPDGVYFLLVFIGFIVVVGAFIIMPIINTMSAALNSAKEQCDKSASEIRQTINFRENLVAGNTKVTYVNTAEAYLKDKVITGQSVNVIGRASVELLENGSLSVLSEFNTKLDSLVKESKNNGAVNPDELRKAEIIDQANSKAIDAWVNSSI